MHFFKNLKLNKKLWIFSFFFIGNLLLSTGISFWLMGKLANNTQNLAEVQLPSVRKMTLIDMMHDGLRAVVLDAYVNALEKKDKELPAVLEESKEKQELIIRYMAELELLDLDKETMKQVKVSIADVKLYSELSQELVGYAAKRDLVKFRAKMPEFQTQFEVLEEKLGSLGDLIVGNSEVIQKASMDMIAFETYALIGLCAVVIFVGLVFSAWFINNISSRLAPLTKMIEGINKGDYKVSFSDLWNDELKFLGDSIQVMAGKISEQIESIKTALSESEKAQQSAESAKIKSEAAMVEASQEKQKALEAMAKADEASKLASLEKERVQSALIAAEKHREDALRAQQAAATEQKKILDLARADEEKTTNLKNKIDSILKVVDRAAGGDFKGRVRVSGNEPIEVLASQLNELFERMDTSLSEVDRASRNLNLSAENFVSLNRGLFEAAKTTENLTANVSVFSEKAKHESVELTTQAQDIKNSANEIFNAANLSADSSGEVFEKARAAELVIKELSKATHEIGEFTKVVATISSQTNLLALNATIEAARAGDAGKGFAIVASEVKELAKQTSSAAEKVEEQIKNILDVVIQVESSITQIIEFSEKVKEQSNNVFSSVNVQTQSTQKMFDLIGKSIQNIDEINTNLTSVKKVAGDSTQAAQSIQTETHKMSELSHKLRDVVKQFKTSDEQNSVRAVA